MSPARIHKRAAGTHTTKGAPGFESLLAGEFGWNPAFIEKIQTTSPQVKSRFDQVMNR